MRVVLVVEDEPLLRLTLSDALRRAGLSVIAVGSGREALERAAAARGAIDWLVCDLSLRGQLDGYEVGAALSALCPGVSVILISGYPDPETAGFEPLPAGWRFLEKPFRPEALCEVIAREGSLRAGNGEAARLLRRLTQMD